MPKTRACGSSANSMSRRTVSSFWNEHASATFPGNCASSHSRTCSADHCSTSFGSKENLLQGVAAQAAAERLERDHLVGRDVPEVHVRADGLHEPRLRGLRRRLEDKIANSYGVRDAGDDVRPHATVSGEDAGR